MGISTVGSLFGYVSLRDDSGKFRSKKYIYVMTQKVYILWLRGMTLCTITYVGSGTKVTSVVDAFENNVMVR